MIAQFALRLICGMSLMWALMPRRQVTSGFFRIQMLVVMGLGVLAALSSGLQATNEAIVSTNGAAVLSGILGFTGFVGSALWTLERRSAGERLGFGIFALSTISLLLTHLPQLGLHHFEWRLLLSHITDASVLGATTVGMLLGHWYLTAPAMSIEPLKRINVFLGVSGVMRLMVSTLTLHTLATRGINFGELEPSIPPAWLGMRWLAGVIGPLVVSLMVWRILKYRNTQAATGVLFVGVILAFIGDMTAALLLRETGLPL